MIYTTRDLEQKFYMAFTEWFKNGGCDFWSESNAPEELAKVATNVLYNIWDEEYWRDK